MAKVYYESDCNIQLLQGKKIAVIGYGSQGHAHSLNLQDSGMDVVVGLYEGSKSWQQAEQAGLRVMAAGRAAEQADVIMMLVPDEKQKGLFESEIRGALAPGKTLMFAHGFNIHYSQIVPPNYVDVSMIAPKAPGHRMRELFTAGLGVPALLAVHQNATETAKEVAL
ncbi:MAG: NAD(P)-binding domain-containing protein, partial [Planctomycetes bacterium]|nr:NAD(P)-binding domain-containing protein [Planctomycetota bacterium]